MRRVVFQHDGGSSHPLTSWVCLENHPDMDMELLVVALDQRF